jgi:TctA family transporter
VVLITFLAPMVAKFALKFGPPEFFSVYLLTFCSFVGMGKGSRLKIVAAMALGFGLAAVGMDTISGGLRMTFGIGQFLRGFDFLVVVIGLFGISEILITLEEGLAFKGKKAALDLQVVLKTWRQLPKYWLTLLRSSAVGCWLGITPGGAVAASFMGYGLAKKFARDPDRFGKGALEGVVAPETAAHAAGTSALLPMLALGIPGSATAAVLLGGLMVWGLQPGPLLFVEQPQFVWGLIASMYLGNIAGLVVVLTTVPLFAAILRIPFAIVAPVIIVACAIGAFSVHSAMFDVWLMLVFGVLGYVFKKLDYPLAPMVLAVVLGDRAEDAFRQAILGSQGDLRVFWSHPLSATISSLALLLLFWPLLTALIQRFRPRARRWPRRERFPRGRALHRRLRRGCAEVRFDALMRGLYATDALRTRCSRWGGDSRDARDVRVTLAACREASVPVLPVGGGTSVRGSPSAGRWWSTSASTSGRWWRSTSTPGGCGSSRGWCWTI